MTLASDLAWYKQNRATFVKNFLNQFVLIKDARLIGEYPTYEAALRAATSMFGTQEFLIHHVLDPEPVQRIG